MARLQVEKRVSSNAGIETIEAGWRLILERGQAGAYRLAQLDDYSQLSRAAFLHKPELHLSLMARTSQKDLPGTWGFGLWNDPFGSSLGFGGKAGRLPALPNAAWFFCASPENHLAFDDASPAKGFTATVFRSARIPAAVMALGLPLLPLLAVPKTARWLRRRAAQFIRQEGRALEVDPTKWHEYEIHWGRESAVFSIDSRKVFETQISPLPPLGLVLWIDNQFAAWPEDGRMRYGTLATPANSWLEIKDLHLY